MFSNVLVALLVSSILILNDRKYVSCTDENGTIDALNKLLESSGWNNIGDLKVRLPGKKNYSFAVSDLLYRNGAEFDRIVNENNYTDKYDMVIYSVSCVYANALVKFMDLTKIILQLSTLERHRLGTKIYRETLETSELKSKKRSADDSNKRDDLVDKNYLDEPSSSGSNPDEYTDSWKIFNCAIRLFNKSWSMFEFMSAALRFLQGLVPEEYFKTLKYHKTGFVSDVSFYKDVSTDIKIVLPDYVGPDDRCYMNKFSRLSRRFSVFLNATQPLDRFLDDHCTIPEEDDRPAKAEEKYVPKTVFKKKVTRTNVEEKFDIVRQVEEQIESLVDQVTRRYFKDLGFVYDFTK